MSDNLERFESSDPSARRTGRGVVIGLIVLILYIESPVVVGKLLNKTEAWSVAGPVFVVVFAPLEFLYERFEFVKSFYDWLHNR